MRRAIVVVLVLAACRGSERTGGSGSAVPQLGEPPLPVDDPARIEDEDTLVIPAVRTPSGSWELHFGRGRALLSMSAGTLVAPEPRSGALALNVLAKWLGVAVPAKTHTQPLRPLTFESVGLSDTETKVFFQRGAEYAEMYINVRDETHLEFVPKDPDYAGPLADMFADALRDGPAPARTSATDPTLETEEPRFRTGRALSLSGAHDAGRTADGWIAFVPGDASETAWFGSWGKEPAKLCDLPGAVDGVAFARRGKAAVVLVTGRGPRSGIRGGSQTATLWAVGPAGCHAIATPKDLSIGPFTGVNVSPSGTEVAIVGDSTLVTLPFDKGKVTRSPIGELGWIYQWDDEGVQLHDLENHRSRVTPGTPVAKIDHHTTLSPDGVYRVTLLDAWLEVVDVKTRSPRTFEPTFRSDVRAIQRADDEPPPWIAPHALVLRGSPDLVLDVATLRTRPLSDPGDTVVCASHDGAHALVSREDTLFESK